MKQVKGGPELGTALPQLVFHSELVGTINYCRLDFDNRQGSRNEMSN